MYYNKINVKNWNPMYEYEIFYIICVNTKKLLIFILWNVTNIIAILVWLD